MAPDDIESWRHSHTFGTQAPRPGETKARWVILVTVVTMVGELVAGTVFGSMALLADGWHMVTHAAALCIAAFAYAYARRFARDPRYTFGTGKVSALGGFGSAVVLGVVALFVSVESIERLVRPVPIRFDEAIAVAVIGLVVNVVSAVLLHDRDDHDHHQGSAHHHDHNLRGMYLHVLADALTSVLAIAALLAGKFFELAWLDAATGIVGSAVIARWALGLVRETSRVLLDAEVSTVTQEAIRGAIEREGDARVCDLHVWRIGPHHLAAIVSVVAGSPKDPSYYKARLSEFPDIQHITVEVHCPGGRPAER